MSAGKQASDHSFADHDAARAWIATQQYRPSRLHEGSERRREIDDMAGCQARADNTAQTHLRDAKRLSCRHVLVLSRLSLLDRADLDVAEPDRVAMMLQGERAHWFRVAEHVANRRRIFAPALLGAGGDSGIFSEPSSTLVPFTQCSKTWPFSLRIDEFHSPAGRDAFLVAGIIEYSAPVWRVGPRSASG